MEFQVRVTGRGLATAAAGIAAAGMIGYLWMTTPDKKIEYKSAERISATETVYKKWEKAQKPEPITSLNRIPDEVNAATKCSSPRYMYVFDLNRDQTPEVAIHCNDWDGRGDIDGMYRLFMLENDGHWHQKLDFKGNILVDTSGSSGNNSFPDIFIREPAKQGQTATMYSWDGRTYQAGQKILIDTNKALSNAQVAQGSGHQNANPVAVKYDTAIHSSVASLRREAGKAKSLRRLEFRENTTINEVPAQITTELQCNNNLEMERMRVQFEDIDGDGTAEIKAYCPAEVGGSGTLYFHMYRTPQADGSHAVAGDKKEIESLQRQAENSYNNDWFMRGRAIERLKEIYSVHSLQSASAMQSLTPAEQREVEHLQLRIRNQVKEWDARHKLYEIEKLQLMKSRVSNGKWQKIYTGGNFGISDEIINDMPVLYEFTDILLGDGSQAERRKSMLVKHAFNGREYKAVMKIIDRDDLAQGVTSVAQSRLPDRDKERQFSEMQETFGPDAMIDAYSYMNGIDAANAEEFQTYLNSLNAYSKQQHVFSSPANLGLFFAERVVYHLGDDARSQAAAQDRIRKTNAMYENELPRTPFRSNDLIGTRRSSSAYGGTERGYIAPSATAERSEELRRNWAIQQDSQRIDSNRQSIPSNLGRDARAVGGAALGAVGNAANQGIRGIADFVNKTQQKPKDKR